MRAPAAGSLLRSQTTALVAVDDTLTVTYLNDAAENLLGLSERQVIGRPIELLVQPAADLVKLCKRALGTGLTIGLREFSARIGERELNLSCQAAPIEGERGLLLELFDTDRDSTIRREAEIAAQRKLSRQVIRQLAHEVKNPLVGLRGAAQLLARQLPRAELKDYTRVIIDEADRLAAMVDSVLSTGGAPVPEDFNLHEITERVANLLVAEIAPGVEVVRDYDPSLPQVRADRSQMIQAFLNLARNAMQAVGAQGRIVLRTRALHNHSIDGEQHRLVLSAEVEDNGPGVSADLAGTIFYPLVTGRASGTGLGLTIAQDLVSRNGGYIEYVSKPGKTVFRMRLPVNGTAASA